MRFATYSGRGRWGGQRGQEFGQTLVEFALSLLVFVTIIMGIVDLSRAVYARNAVASMAREGARYAAVRPQATPAQVEAVAEELAAGLDRGEVQVNLVRLGVTHVEVTVTYRFHAVTPLIGRIVDGGSGAGMALRGRSLMRVES